MHLYAYFFPFSSFPYALGDFAADRDWWYSRDGSSAAELVQRVHHIKKQPATLLLLHFFAVVCTAIRELAGGGPNSQRGVKMQSKHTQTPWYVCSSAMCVHRRQFIWVGGDATAITRRRFDDGRQLWNLYLRFNNLPGRWSDTCAAHFLPCWQHLRSRTAIAFTRVQKEEFSINRRAIFQSAFFARPGHFGKQLKINRCWTFNFAS